MSKPSSARYLDLWKWLRRSCMIRDPSTHYQLTQIRFIAETFSTGGCLVFEGLPAINS